MKLQINERVTNTRFNETNFNTAIGYNNEEIIKYCSIYLYNRSIIGIPEEIGAQSTSKEKYASLSRFNNKNVEFK